VCLRLTCDRLFWLRVSSLSLTHPHTHRMLHCTISNRTQPEVLACDRFTNTPTRASRWLMIQFAFADDSNGTWNASSLFSETTSKKLPTPKLIHFASQTLFHLQPLGFTRQMLSTRSAVDRRLTHGGSFSTVATPFSRLVSLRRSGFGLRWCFGIGKTSFSPTRPSTTKPSSAKLFFLLPPRRLFSASHLTQALTQGKKFFLPPADVMRQPTNNKKTIFSALREISHRASNNRSFARSQGHVSEVFSGVSRVLLAQKAVERAFSSSSSRISRNFLLRLALAGFFGLVQECAE
jgi:hypothetical protein